MKIGKLIREHHFCKTPLMPGFEGGMFVLGRIDEQSTENEMETFILCKSEKVSKRHCKITFRQKAFWIKDLGTRCGTLLNGEEMLPHVERELRFGDVVQVGILKKDEDIKDASCFLFSFQSHQVQTQGIPEVLEQMQLKALQESCGSLAISPARKIPSSSSSVEFLDVKPAIPMLNTDAFSSVDEENSTGLGYSSDCGETVLMDRQEMTTSARINAKGMVHLQASAKYERRIKPGPLWYHQRQLEKRAKRKARDKRAQEGNHDKLSTKKPEASTRVGFSNLKNIPHTSTPVTVNQRHDTHHTKSIVEPQHEVFTVRDSDSEDDSSDGMSTTSNRTGSGDKKSLSAKERQSTPTPKYKAVNSTQEIPRQKKDVRVTKNASSRIDTNIPQPSKIISNKINLVSDEFSKFEDEKLKKEVPKVKLERIILNNTLILRYRRGIKSSNLNRIHRQLQASIYRVQRGKNNQSSAADESQSNVSSSESDILVPVTKSTKSSKVSLKSKPKKKRAKRLKSTSESENENQTKTDEQEQKETQNANKSKTDEQEQRDTENDRPSTGPSDLNTRMDSANVAMDVQTRSSESRSAIPLSPPNVASHNQTTRKIQLIKPPIFKKKQKRCTRSSPKYDAILTTQGIFSAKQQMQDRERIRDRLKAVAVSSNAKSQEVAPLVPENSRRSAPVVAKMTAKNRTESMLETQINSGFGKRLSNIPAKRLHGNQTQSAQK